MSHNSQVQLVWHIVYDLLRGPGSAKTYSSYLSLEPRFEEDLLGDIAALQEVTPEDRAQTVEAVRAKVFVAHATGLFGDTDLERINTELDKLIEGE
ncbi:MAG TPA: hypothetical protein VK694_02165 [Verrucomicrobiae bacterium]|nr:hypothetical protein [Verrucomicrobiae bacterium]